MNILSPTQNFAATNNIKILCLAALLVVSLSGDLPAQDYLGANAVVQAVLDRSAKPGEKPAKDESTKLRDDLKSFTETVTNLAPDAAAKRWLEFVDQALKIQVNLRQNLGSPAVPIRADDLFRALPPPSAWNELARAIAARPPAKAGEEMPAAGLRLLAATLTHDVAAQNREFTNLQALAKNADVQNSNFYNNTLQEIGQATLNISEDPDAILKSLGYQMMYGNGQSAHQLEVPNLVSLIGADKAEVFLRQALVTPGLTLQFTTPNETSRMAQKLALELLPQLKTPPWGLVNSLDAVDLYEALDKKFSAPAGGLSAIPALANLVPDMSQSSEDNDAPKRGAQIYYLLGLISKNRMPDAIAMAKHLKGLDSEYMFEEAFKAMENAGYTKELDDFLHESLAQDPTLPFWDQYVEVAASASQTKRMLALMQAAVARDDLSDAKKAALRQILFKALLAADDVDGATQEMRRLIAQYTANPNGNGDGYNAGQLGVMMANIGALVQKPELTDEGITVAKKWLASPAAQNPDGTTEVLESLTQRLFELKRGPEAEAMLTDALTRADRAAQAGNASETYAWFNHEGGPAREILTDLLTLYYQAGRTNDVLALLRQSPDWGAKDVSELFGSSSWNNPVSLMFLHTGTSPLPVPYLAAMSLLPNGQKAQSHQINDALLDLYPGLDRGYELLLTLDGTNAYPRLDELFSRDQFEERPLIWKAHLLRQQNRLDEAEKVIRQAIAIDPSDGEEGRGDRMRAYAELADILDAKNDLVNAGFYLHVVQAIRMSEHADQFYQAGLLSRAVPMYETALGLFSDAYCIQSRLAIQLADLGKNAEAEEHYRRAYELMPDSFGRVESHCFGCERAFDGKTAQGIAEQVFTKLCAERPNKPQVHYLLGYLRSEQERYHEALTNYQAAVRLDPDYLNAWVKMQDVAGQTILPTKERDEIAFNILRLDPLQRHSHAEFERVTDLNRLWNAVADTASHQPPPADNLMTLDASKTALEAKMSKASSGIQPSQLGLIEERVELFKQMNGENHTSTPGQAVGKTQFMKIAGGMILNDNYTSD